MKPPPRKGAAATAQEERLRKLQEYLAAKGKQKQPSAKPYLKEKTSQQNQAPSKSDPIASCKKNIVLNKTKGAPKREAKYSVPASQVRQSKLSSASISQKPRSVLSELHRKGPLRPLPSKASAGTLSGKVSVTVSSTKHSVCQIRKTKKLETVTEPRTRTLQRTAKSLAHQNHHVAGLQKKAHKENFESKNGPSLERKAAPRLGLPTGSQTVNSRSNGGLASRGRVQVRKQGQTYHVAKSQIQGNARGLPSNLKGADVQKQVPGLSGAQIASTYSRPEVKSRGLMKQCTRNPQAAGVHRQGKENAARSRTCKAPGVLQKGPSKQQRVSPRKAQPVRRPLTRLSVTELRNGKCTLSLAAPDNINKHGSTAKRSQDSKKLQQEPGPPSLKPRPFVSADCTPNRAADFLRSERSKPRQPGMGTGQELKTPCMQDRRKLLEQWLKSRAKSYKRPPMRLSTAKSWKKRESLDHSFWSSLEQEEQTVERSLVDKISSALTECLKLTEEGFPSEEILTMLSQIPEAEKFAQFWICKAKLLARGGPFDVAGLYEAAVCAGAVPLQKLKEVVVELLMNPAKTAQVIPTQVEPLPVREQVKMTPQSTLRCPTHKPVSGIKLQVLPLPLLRAKEHNTGPAAKLLTPVRRSLRIESAVSCYPQMLKDHDPVVTSLDELMAKDCASFFVFRKNEALPEDMEMEVLRL